MTARHGRSGGMKAGVIAGWALMATVMASDAGRAAEVGPNADPVKRDDATAPIETTPTPTPRPLPDATSPAAAPGARATDAKAKSAPGAASIVYVPPSRGQARHTAGAGTRGLSPTAGRPGETRPRVAIVAPRDHVGLTTSAAPTLYWHLSAPTTTRIELTVVDDEAIEPVVQVALPGPVAAGLHALELSKLGVTLAPDKTYRWFVALVHDAHRRSKDELAEGAIERVGADPADVAARASTSPRPMPETAIALQSAARRAARDGYWYDAFADLSTAIERDPADGALAAERQSLLDQARVGIDLR